MKITKKQIKQLIEEELSSLLEQAETYIVIKNFEGFEVEGVRSVMYGDQLIEVWEDSLVAFFDREEIGWSKNISDEEINKIIQKFDNDLEEFFEPENWNQFAEMLLIPLDPEFKGIPSGYIAFSDDSATDLLATYAPGEPIKIENLENVKNPKKHMAKLSLSTQVDLGQFEVDDGYIIGVEEYEMMHSTDRYVYINLEKIIEDINSGQIKIKIEHGPGGGNIHYTLVKY